MLSNFNFFFGWEMYTSNQWFKFYLYKFFLDIILSMHYSVPHNHWIIFLGDLMIIQPRITISHILFIIWDFSFDTVHLNKVYAYLLMLICENMDLYIPIGWLNVGLHLVYKWKWFACLKNFITCSLVNSIIYIFVTI